MIGGEAPVLTIRREIVRRCARRSIEMEKLRMSGRLDTLAIDTNRYIALDEHPMLARIISCRLQLEVEVILKEVDERSVKSEE